MPLAMIWAQSADGVIGVDGGLPWHLPEDMAHFRTLTAGCPVVMGRATWESLPPRWRPLPGRRNVVLSGRPGLVLDGAEVVPDVATALALVGDALVWVVGGAEVYREMLPHADRLEVTDVDVVVGRGTRAPVVPAGWHEVRREPVDGWATSSNGLGYRFRTLVRGSAGRGTGGQASAAEG